ncbi:MAG: hypothetical protein SGI88_18170 [Candidatus Hydrogenedentes bacterium]|nr:hypothetical protein [Candidatus Hydrogenedentota bacterium]
MRRGMSTLAVIGIFSVARIAFAEQTLESVENDVEKMWAKINSFSANVTSDTNVTIGPATMKTHATGTLECLKKGEQSLFRLDMVNKIDTGIPLAGAMEQKMLSVFDGKAIFNDMEAMGMRQVFRVDPEEAGKQGPMTGKSMFETLRAQGELKLLPDATIDGKSVYVVEVTPSPDTKAAAPMDVGLMRVYISKELGLQVKMEVLDEKAQPLSTTVYNDIKVNVALAPERFVYTVPEGVKVQDMSEIKKLQESLR